LFQSLVLQFNLEWIAMQKVIDQVMRTYGLMVNLTPAEEQAARERLETFLKDKPDSSKLAVEGVKFLRGARPSRTRCAWRRLQDLPRHRLGLRHPDRAWCEELGCQCGAGMPCGCVRADGLEEPDVSRVLEELPQHWINVAATLLSEPNAPVARD
jgi:hypothetical protein